MSKIPFYYLTPILIWGVSWYAIKINVHDTSEALKNFSIASRFLIAAVILLGFCLITRKKLRLSKIDHLFVALQALFLFTLNYFFFYKAMKYVESGIVGVISSTIMFLNVLNSRFILKMPVKKSSLILAFVGLSGILLIFQSTFEKSIGKQEMWWGIIWALVGSYMTSLGNIVSSFNQRKKRSIAVTNAYGMLYASIAMLLYVYCTSGFPTFFSDTGEFILKTPDYYIWSLLFLAVGTSAISYGCYLSLVGIVGPPRAAYVFFVTPIIAMVVSTTQENYEWTWQGGLGIFIILVGCLALLITASKEKKKLQSE